MTKGQMKANIRTFSKNDLDPLYQLLSDEEVMRYLEPPFSYEKTKEFLDAAGLSDPPKIYAVDDENGDFIGYVICHDYEEDSMEIGWVLRRDVWGKGLAGELTGQLIDTVHSRQKAVIIECAPEQSITKHIAEAFGFAYCGKRDGCDVYRLDVTDNNG